jgi:hypothetical protein
LHVANELLTLPVVFAGPLKAVTGGIPPDFIPEVGVKIDVCKALPMSPPNLCTCHVGRLEGLTVDVRDWQALRLRQNADAFLRDQADRQTEALTDILSAADRFRRV